jgi:hypothetical protein
VSTSAAKSVAGSETRLLTDDPAMAVPPTKAKTAKIVIALFISFSLFF